MKKDIHPDYREVVFQDVQSDFKFLTRSTIKSEETIKWEDGKEYPLIKVEVSSASHPFYTGKKIFVDTAGRVDKFNKRYQSLKAAKDVADKKIIEERQENTSKESVTNENPEPKAKSELAETSDQEKESDVAQTLEAPAAEEVKDEAPAAEEVKDEAPAAEEVKEEAPATEEVKEEAPATEEVKEKAPAAEEVKEEAPAAEEVKEEAPAAEEVKEEAPATDLTSEDIQKEDS